MKSIRLQTYRHLHFADDVRLRDMFDGALPPEPPDAPAPPSHDFLVMCLRPEEPPAPPTITRALRSAA